jgi:hypothetical protein
MNISDYSTKVKNLIDAFAFIGTLVKDEDLVVMTLNGLGKYYNQFCTLIVVRETFFDFQNLITLFISEKMKIIGTSSNGGSQKMFFIQILIEVKVEVLKPHFKVGTEACMVDIINMKVSLMEVDEEILEEEEVVEVMVEVIKVNNQIVTQIAIIMGNMGRWQKTVIKRSMMHEMENYNKGIMHQLAIKVMNNCL